MKSIVLSALFTTAILAGCTGNKSTSSATENHETDMPTEINLSGQWDIANIALSDSVQVCPSEEVPEVRQYVTFEGNGFFIQTNCNTIQGEYRLSGDSIGFPMTLTTEMACDNMATEDALRQILPSISTVSAVNDSTVRLNGSNPSEYILLTKAAGK